VTYPCPYCRATASLESGCPGCGRGPDPDAAAVVRLDGRIGELTARLAAARDAERALDAQLRESWEQRNAAAARVRAAVAAASAPSASAPSASAPSASAPGSFAPGSFAPGSFAPGSFAPGSFAPGSGAPGASAAGFPAAGRPAPVSPPPGSSPAGQPPAAGRPARSREASTRLVQNALFLLGGLLLGVAAIVFTAVAWSQFGVGGRAVLLAAFTAAALTAPLAALRRDLRATAETFAALGLLLVLLDGYAAWHVNLFGVADYSAYGYAGAVCAVTAAVAAGYEHVTGLAGPRYVALVVAQPVFPLVVEPLHPGPDGWAFVFAAVAVLNLMVIHLRRRPLTGVGITAYAWGLFWVVGSGLGALTALATASTTAEAASGGAALVVAVLVLVASALLARIAAAQAVAGGLLVVALGVAGARVLDIAAGQYAVVAVAALVAGLALAVAAVRPLLPAAVRPGPWAGAVAVTVVPAAVALLGVAFAAAGAVEAAQPFLGAGPDREVERSGWQLPAAVGLIAVAVVALLPRAQRRHGVIGGVAALGLAVPAGFGLVWWSAPAVDLLVAAVAVAVAVRTAGPGRRLPVPAAVLWCGAVAGLLVVHAVLTGFGRAAVAAVALGAVALIGAGAAVLARPERRGDAGAVALGAGVLAVPAAVWAATVAFAVPGPGQTRITLAVAAVLAAGAWAVPRSVRPAAHAAALLGLLTAPLWAVGSGDSPAIYAAVALLVVAATVPLGVGAAAPVGVVLGLALAAAVAESVFAVSLAPYEWLDAVWRGRPAGVGLDVAGVAEVSRGDAVAVLLVAVVAAVLQVAARAAGPRATADRARGASVGGASVGGASVGGAAAGGASVGGAAAGGAAAGGAAAGGAPTRGSLVRGSVAVAVWAAVPALIVGVPMLLAATGAVWPAVPAASLAGGLAVLVALALRPPAARGVVVACAVVATVLAAAGLAGALPTHASTLVAFGAVMVAGAVGGSSARLADARVAGWSGAVLAALGFAYTASHALGLALVPAAFVVLGTAAAVVGLGTLLAARFEGRVVQAIGHAGAVAALLLTTDQPRYTALACTLWGLVLGLRACVPGERVVVRHGYVVAAAAAELLGWWVLVADADVAVREAYTLPAAAVALLAGWLALRRRPELTSWVTYGPALAAAMLPTLASVLVDEGQPVRRLALGLGALAVVVGGAHARLQAPVVVGGAVLAAVAVHEVALVWDLLPRWIPLALAGLLLVGLAMTLERRRRDLARVRAAITRMT
jgi:hypothetical protein